jgi:hypothetical protein
VTVAGLIAELAVGPGAGGIDFFAISMLCTCALPLLLVCYVLTRCITALPEVRRLARARRHPPATSAVVAAPSFIPIPVRKKGDRSTENS